MDAVQASLNGAIANGSYLQVLDRWAESDEKIAHSEINPPGLETKHAPAPHRGPAIDDQS